MLALKQVTIYTDGACMQNPGPGGYGVVLLHDGHRKELSGGFRHTTNNRMELMAALVGLGALRYRCRVTLFTDSQYLAEAIRRGWAQRWRARLWMRTPTQKARNHDLWEQLLEACEQHDLTIRWVRGHAGNPENDRCDQLAVAASLKEDLETDAGYEAEQAALAKVPLFEAAPPSAAGEEEKGPACPDCGQTIPAERLEAVPGATLCVACQRDKEIEPAVERTPECPRCAQKGIKAPLVWRTARAPARSGYFLGCSRYPACQYIDR
jgi:ribonuclease HI